MYTTHMPRHAAPNSFLHFPFVLPPEREDGHSRKLHVDDFCMLETSK